MESSGHSQVSDKARPWVVTSTAAIGWAAFAMAIMHIVRGRNPIAGTLSSYAYTRHGGGLLEAAVLSLVTGSIALLGALFAANIRVSGTPSVLLTLWASGLSMAMAFPASLTTHPAPVSGEIHQWSCVVAFLSLPGFGFSVAERMRSRPELADSRSTVLKLSWVAAITLLLFGISYVLPSLRANPALDSLSELLPVGLAQRAALAGDLLLLGGLLQTASRAARSNAAISR